MKKPEIIFRPIGDSGPLSIYWYDGPYGDAVESAEGSGVAWYSPTGELLGVEFDDVNKENDIQKITLQNGEQIEVQVVKGKTLIKFLPKTMRDDFRYRRKKRNCKILH